MKKQSILLLFFCLTAFFANAYKYNTYDVHYDGSKKWYEVRDEQGYGILYDGKLIIPCQYSGTINPFYIKGSLYFNMHTQSHRDVVFNTSGEKMFESDHVYAKDGSLDSSHEIAGTNLYEFGIKKRLLVDDNLKVLVPESKGIVHFDRWDKKSGYIKGYIGKYLGKEGCCLFDLNGTEISPDKTYIEWHDIVGDNGQYAIVESFRGYGLYNLKNNTEAVPAIYSNQKYSFEWKIYNDQYVEIKSSSGSGIYDMVSNTEVIYPEFDSLYFIDGTDYVKVYANGFCGIMNLAGKIVIPFTRRYRSIDYFRTTKSFTYEMDGYYGECNQKGVQLTKKRSASKSAKKTTSATSSSSTSNTTKATTTVSTQKSSTKSVASANSASNKFIFDFPFRCLIQDGSLISSDIKSDVNNAYRVDWQINNNDIAVAIYEVKINSNGVASKIKTIDNFSLSASNLALFLKDKDFQISSNSMVYFYMFGKNCGIRVKGIKGYTLMLPHPEVGMFLYSPKDGSQWNTRTEEYFTKEYNRLLAKLKQLQWGNVHNL